MSNDTDKATVPQDDPIASSILAALAGGESLTIEQLARLIGESRARPKDGPGLWRKYKMAVKQQARHLARQGRVEIIHKGEPVEADDFKGRVHLRLKD